LVCGVVSPPLSEETQPRLLVGSAEIWFLVLFRH
jgi:hypothetical protein